MADIPKRHLFCYREAFSLPLVLSSHTGLNDPCPFSLDSVGTYHVYVEKYLDNKMYKVEPYSLAYVGQHYAFDVGMEGCIEDIVGVIVRYSITFSFRFA